MSDVELTFLQDLAAHGAPKDTDLLLVNTDGDDKTLTLQKLAQYMIEVTYPVGSVKFFAQNKNPNTLFPGTKWSYIGEDKVIRLSKQDGSDLMLTGGSDSVQITAENMPAHDHYFSGETSWFDYGTKQTDWNGEHSHNYISPYGREVVGPDGAGDGQGTKQTSSAGNHQHELYIGSHSHTFSGTTGKTGMGTSLSVANSFIKLMGWYRVS